MLFPFSDPSVYASDLTNYFRPGGHAQKSRYRDFAVSSSLNILRTKTVEHDNIGKQLK